MIFVRDRIEAVGKGACNAQSRPHLAQHFHAPEGSTAVAILPDRRFAAQEAAA